MWHPPKNRTASLGTVGCSATCRTLAGVLPTWVSSNRQINLGAVSTASEPVPVPPGYSQGDPGEW